VTDEGEVNLPKQTGGYVRESMAVVRLSSSWTRELLESAGVDSISISRHGGSTLEGLRLDLMLAMERGSRSVRNVMGKIPGNGEWVLVSAHYDHLGQKNNLWQGKRTYHPGADNNASGVAVLLELARRLRTQPSSGRRGLIFVAFAGGEVGLAGSRHTASHPPVPLDQVAAVVNMDMVGRLGDGPLNCYGTGSANGFGDIVKGVLSRVAPDLPVALNSRGSSPSDQAPFLAMGVPVLHWMTPPHEDTRRLTDTWDKIDGDGLLGVADLMEALVETLRVVERPQFTGAVLHPQAR
jgi:Zn-dependent M28 family amino/carboxypeptidase